MSKKKIQIFAAVFTFVFAFASAGYAITLLKPKKALQQVLGKNAEIVVETQRLKGETLAKVKERLGGKLIDFQEGSESAEVKGGKTKIDFHFSIKDGKKTRVAIFDEEPGKWGPVEYIIGLTMNGAVKKVRVMSYTEKRGRPIARVSFLKQYEGKTSRSQMVVGKDITGISGATISSKSATFAVKKAIVLYEELYLKNK